MRSLLAMNAPPPALQKCEPLSKKSSAGEGSGLLVIQEASETSHDLRTTWQRPHASTGNGCGLGKDEGGYVGMDDRIYIQWPGNGAISTTAQCGSERGTSNVFIQCGPFFVVIFSVLQQLGVDWPSALRDRLRWISLGHMEFMKRTYSNPTVFCKDSV